MFDHAIGVIIRTLTGWLFSTPVGRRLGVESDYSMLGDKGGVCGEGHSNSGLLRQLFERIEYL